MTTPAPISPQRRSSTLPIALVLLLTAIVLARLCTAEFTMWDDTYNIIDKNAFKAPIAASLAYFWNPANPQSGLYVPLTYTIWRLIATIAHVQPIGNSPALNPWIFHAANLILHLITVALVYRILLRLIKMPWPAAAGAALFAIHPVQVEAVGWLSGLKDVMAGLFSMAAILQYLRAYQEASPNRKTRYGSSVVFFFAAVLSKPSVMAVPLGLVALEVLGFVRAAASDRRNRRAMASRLLPFFLIALATAANSWRLQGRAELLSVPLLERPLIVGDSLAFYLGRLVWPIGLTFDYDRTPQHVLDSWGLYVNWLAPAIIALYCWLARRHWPTLTLAFCFFIAGCLPNLGWTRFLFQYFSTVADHYFYPAMLGPALALAWLLTLCAHPKSIRLAAAILTTIAVAIFSVISFRQTAVWQDDFTLFGHALAVNPDCFLANNNYGVTLQHADRGAESLPYFQRAARLRERHYPSFSNLAITLANLGRYPEAIVALKHSLAIQEELAKLNGIEPRQSDYYKRDAQLLRKLISEESTTRSATRPTTMPIPLQPEPQ